MAIIGTIIQVSLLIVNAIAILNEERFLAKSELLCKCKSYNIAKTELIISSWMAFGITPCS
jgi:Yos1-like